VPEEKDDPTRRSTFWRPVDPAIWAAGPPRTRSEYVIQRFLEGARFLTLGLIVIIGPFGVLFSFLIAYDLVGVKLFGPVLLSIWSVAIVTFIIIMERTGYARNFQNSNFSIRRRMLALPVAFLMVLGIILLLYVIAHPGIV